MTQGNKMFNTKLNRLNFFRNVVVMEGNGFLLTYDESYNIGSTRLTRVCLGIIYTYIHTYMYIKN